MQILGQGCNIFKATAAYVVRRGTNVLNLLEYNSLLVPRKNWFKLRQNQPKYSMCHKLLISKESRKRGSL